MTLFVGLTGGIGTGKSTALEAFRKMGAAAISLDEIARRLSRKNGPVYRAIARSFGRRFLSENGELDRGALADFVFRHPSRRKRLERATHPLILREMRRRMKRSSEPVVVVDVPLLFEVRAEKMFDLSVLVSASPSAAMRRVAKRDGWSRARTAARMNAQMPLRRKRALADVVIVNEGKRRDLEKKAGEYYRAFDLIAERRYALGTAGREYDLARGAKSRN